MNVANESTVKADIDAGTAAAMQGIVESLTTPLTAEEKSPKPKLVKPLRVAFNGSYEEVNRFYYKNGWTDGLPIVPPTEKALAEMMTGTDLPADHVVAKVIPRLGKAVRSFAPSSSFYYLPTASGSPSSPKKLSVTLDAPPASIRMNCVT